MKKLAIAGGGAAGVLAMAFVLLVTMISGGVKAAKAAASDCVTAPVTADAGGPVRWPMVGTFTVTSEFGMRVNPGSVLGGQYRLHEGIDLGSASGAATVVAAKAGTVTGTPTDRYGGNQVVVDVGAGVVHTYKHFASRLVQPGERVWAGKPLGVEGATGNVSGPHLHFEVRASGQLVNPRTWFTQQGLVVPKTGGSTVGAAAAAIAPGNLGAIPTAASSSSSSAAASLTSAGVVASLPAQVGMWRGEQVVNAAHIIRAGTAMRLDDWTITVGVMTAMLESSLKVLNQGDAVGPDSRGLFQQRGNGAWGSYADRMNPEISATNFFKALVAVPGYRQLPPTTAAHRAQRNADPNAYTKMWAPAVQMVATLTANPDLLKNLPAAPAGCANGQPAAGGAIPPAAKNGGSGALIVQMARRWLGTPYSWGGGGINGPGKGVYTNARMDGSTIVGFDCSGLVQFAVYRGTGITLPRTAEQQTYSTLGSPVQPSIQQMRPGDVVSFSKRGGAPGSWDHIGIYAGGGQMIHAVEPGKPLAITTLFGNPYWEGQTWAVKRYTSN